MIIIASIIVGLAIFCGCLILSKEIQDLRIEMRKPQRMLIDQVVHYDNKEVINSTSIVKVNEQV